MKNTSLFSISIIMLLIAFTAACSTDSNIGLQEPTFDGVEDEMFSIEGLEPEPVQDGIEKYIFEEGYGEDRVVIRDQLFIFVTLSTMDGDIIYSSYQNGRTSPDPVTVLNIQPAFPRNFQIQRAFTNGLRKGLIGMREGEKRVIIVPPSEGFENIQSGSLNEAFRNQTLRYDIELNAIL